MKHQVSIYADTQVLKQKHTHINAFTSFYSKTNTNKEQVYILILVIKLYCAFLILLLT